MQGQRDKLRSREKYSCGRIVEPLDQGHSDPVPGPDARLIGVSASDA